MLPEIHKFIDSPNTGKAFFPLTDVYNEGVLLRVLFQFAIDHPDASYSNKDAELILNHAPGTCFFCEGHLYPHFRKRIDKNLYETDTHADGVIGNFKIRQDTKARIIITPETSHFAIIEAKLNSKLSKGIRNAPFYDQAARTVACIAETIFEADVNPISLDRIGFYILAPEKKIKVGTFNQKLEKESIDEKIQRRIGQYGLEHQKALQKWYEQWVAPTLSSIIIKQISWETIIDSIIQKFSDRTDVYEFYQKCLIHNGV